MTNKPVKKPMSVQRGAALIGILRAISGKGPKPKPKSKG